MSFYKKKDLSGLSHDEALTSAKNRIYKSASAREQSSAKMVQKLTQAGYSKDVINEAMERVVELGIIDDRRYSECLIRTTLASRHGLENVLKEIESLGIDKETLQSYQDYISKGEDSQLEDAVYLLDTHPPRSKNVYSACYRKLVSKGFSSAIAYKASKIFCEKNKTSD